MRDAISFFKGSRKKPDRLTSVAGKPVETVLNDVAGQESCTYCKYSSLADYCVSLGSVFDKDLVWI